MGYRPAFFALSARSFGAAVALCLSLGSVSIATAQRPTEGGLFSFDPADDVQTWDEPGGVIRVHYSVSGPNATLPADEDNDLIPDYPQDVARKAAEVLQFFATSGFRPPVSEADLALGELGGSAALDIYLVDFGLSADGSFGLDQCDTSRCAGYLIIENDFTGYSYPSLEVAVDVLTSHELFHGVQYAYSAGLPIWFSEGSAVWAEKQWDPGSTDFLRFASAYLGDTDRSVDRPPGGPVPTFAYSTGIVFDFLTTRNDSSLIADILQAIAESDAAELDVMAEIETALGGAEVLRDEWLELTAWNLATGTRAGARESYAYAAELPGISARAEGSSIDDDNRFYPLAATYYRIDHAGGQLHFGTEGAAPDVVFALFPVQGGNQDGPVADAVATWTAENAGTLAVADGADLPAGGYWLVGSKPVRAAESTKVRFCLGDEDAASACVSDESGGGCSVSSSPGPSAAWLIALLSLLSWRRRRAPGLRTDAARCGR